MPFDSDDLSALFREHIIAAIAGSYALNLQGSGSKNFYGRPASGKPLKVNAHQGVINYQPSELIITVRCGTRLTDIEALMDKQNQIFAFEPPYFGPDATIGGVIATGLSGPRRPYAGSVRDAVLGVRLINGKGEIVKFGGEVLKNVAGFDISRLMTGALGTLGLLLDVSLKVLPQPEQECTLLFQAPQNQAIVQINEWTRQGWPLSAACHYDNGLYIRLSGAKLAVKAAREKLGGERLTHEDACYFWSNLREHRLAFFQDDRPLWRLSLSAAAMQPKLAGDCLIDWGGYLRWLKTDEPPIRVISEAQRLGGHACCFRSVSGSQFQPLPPALKKVHQGLKMAFDPHGVFNPGRMYSDW